MASILFRRTNEVSSDDVDEDDTWDDSVLVDAYDKAVGLAMKEVQRRMEKGHDSDDQEKGSKKKTKKKRSGEKNRSVDGPVKWKVGAPCQAVYSEDNNIYEAIIVDLSSDEETCTVQFIGYNNTQNMPIVDLLRTGGRQAMQRQHDEAQLAQESEAQAAAMEWTSASTDAPPAPQNIQVKKEHASSSKRMQGKKEAHHAIDSHMNMGIPPPPPISQFTANLPADEAEALSSMCMAWYMNGFHTGYYMGLKQGQQPK